jgi:hypothetical protein
MVQLTTTESRINSRSLRTALDEIRPITIGKAFPNWNEVDSLQTREDGTIVKIPDFGRIFTFEFRTEAEADAGR